MRTPHTCPVCAGRGQLPQGFYEGTPNSIYGQVGCRTCSGAGIVWDPLETPAETPSVPFPPIAPWDKFGPLPYVGDPLPPGGWPGGAGFPGPFQYPFTTWIEVSSPDAAGVFAHN